MTMTIGGEPVTLVDPVNLRETWLLKVASEGIKKLGNLIRDGAFFVAIGVDEKDDPRVLTFEVHTHIYIYISTYTPIHISGVAIHCKNLDDRLLLIPKLRSEDLGLWIEIDSGFRPWGRWATSAACSLGSPHWDLHRRWPTSVGKVKASPVRK